MGETHVDVLLPLSELSTLDEGLELALGVSTASVGEPVRRKRRERELVKGEGEGGGKGKLLEGPEEAVEE